MTPITRLTCACKRVQLQVEGAPILGAECHCNSCRTAGARFQALGGVEPVLEHNGGTPFVLYRKDRIRFLEGTEVLKELRLTPVSKTRRVVATCCNTPVFLEFENGHWLSLYRGLWPKDAAPPLELRTMTSDLPRGFELDDTLPYGARQSVTFFAKLLGAWVAMGFRAPKITVVHGELRA